MEKEKLHGEYRLISQETKAMNPSSGIVKTKLTFYGRDNLI